MNIFVPFADINQSVRSLDDKRVVKMVLETCQILSSAMHLLGKPGPYKLTHKNHPCVKWAIKDGGHNFDYLVGYFSVLLSEYTFRFQKTHKCSTHFHEFLYFNSIKWPFGAEPVREFVNCTPFKNIEIHQAYRMHLIQKWQQDKRPPQWTRRNPPTWIAAFGGQIELEDAN